MSLITSALENVNIGTILGSPLISLIGMAYPPAAPVIAILQRFAPVISAAQPVVAAAIEEGKPAFEAAVKAAPNFATALTTLIHQVTSSGGNLAALLPNGAQSPDPAVQSAVVLENLTRNLVGFRGMTFDEELAWMNATTPYNNPAEENSRAGSG